MQNKKIIFLILLLALPLESSYSHPLIFHTKTIINQYITPKKVIKIKKYRYINPTGMEIPLPDTLWKHKRIVNLGWKFRNQRHPVTNIIYNKNGFPDFDEIYSFRLPSNYLTVNNKLQFKTATRSLRQRINQDTELRKKFTSIQLSQIEKNMPLIDGLSWHHSQKKGILELVDREIHDKTPHTGGNAIWGGDR